MKVKNWKISDKVSLYIQWTNKITGSEVEIRENPKRLWDITIIRAKEIPLSVKYIIENCESREIAKLKAISWMQKHPNY